MQTYNLKKKDWLLKMNLIINNMSMYFQLNCGIHLKNLDSSKKSNGHKTQKVDYDDGAAFKGAKISCNGKTKINSLLSNGLPTITMPDK